MEELAELTRDKDRFSWASKEDEYDGYDGW